jgi:hypothetical protein
MLLRIALLLLVAINLPSQAWSYWKPVSPARWQIQFSGALDTTVNASIYDVDLFDTSAATISTLHAANKKVICYFSAGTYESWRSDASAFPAAVIGKPVGNWAGENWLNIGNLTALGPIMGARLDLARSKACDAVSPANVDGYTNASGFALTAAQQINYNTFLANQAHAHGLSIGLMNDMAQIPALVSIFDFAINDSCYDSNQCGLLAPFTSANKPVFNIEYAATTAQFCPSAIGAKFNSIRKNAVLDSYVEFCGTPTTTTNTTTTPPPTTTSTGHWTPAAALRWQIQFSGTVDTSLNVDVYDVDMVGTDAATIQMLHAQGKKVMCYISVGTWEDWRPDASSFPAITLAGPNGDWPGERWLDVRQVSALGTIMGKRMDQAKSKGCDGIDADNMDGYTNNPGVPMTANDQLTYNRSMATLAHNRGLAIGLKNDLLQQAALVNSFDYTISESCYDYSECSYLTPFVTAGKPVFLIEYNQSTSQFCPAANRSNYNAIQKHQALDAWIAFCR